MMQFFSRKKCLGLLLYGVLSGGVAAQAAPEVAIQLRENNLERRFSPGENVTFFLPELPDGYSLQKMVLTHDGYTVLQEKSFLPGEELEIQGTLNQAGFLRCTAYLQNPEGNRKNLLAAAAFEPEKITAGMEEPDDFDAFWELEKARLAQIPADWQKTRLAELSTPNFDVYLVSAANVNGKRIYGVMSVPVAEGKFPAVAIVPGAGPATLSPSFAPNTISLILHVHEYEPQATVEEAKTVEKEFYQSRTVPKGAAKIYTLFDAGDRERYFYHDALLGMHRMLSFLKQEEKYNGRLGFYGGSQGGLVLSLAGWNPDVERIVANVPSFCDFGGILQGRIMGSPSALQATLPDLYEPEVMPGMLYFDNVFFARRITAPVTVLVGWCDIACAPGGVYAMYNNLASKDKKMIDMPLRGHGAWEENAAAWNELIEALHQ